MFGFLKGWRTRIINFAFLVMTVVELSEFRDVLPEQWLPWYSLIIVLVNLLLREITTTPPGRKG